MALRVPYDHDLPVFFTSSHYPSLPRGGYAASSASLHLFCCCGLKLSPLTLQMPLPFCLGFSVNVTPPSGFLPIECKRSTPATLKHTSALCFCHMCIIS